MTTNEWIARNNRKLQELLRNDKPLFLAVSSVMAAQSERIFLKGLNVEGGLIGEYVKKPIRISREWVDSLQWSGGSAVVYAGKNGDTVHKNSRKNNKDGKGGWEEGDEYKTGYFPGGFLEFKESIGRNKDIKTVDLFLTGTLHSHWANNDRGITSIAQAKRLSSHKYVVSITKNDANKVERYGNVFGVNKKELKLFRDVAQYELLNLMK